MLTMYILTTIPISGLPFGVPFSDKAIISLSAQTIANKTNDKQPSTSDFQPKRIDHSGIDSIIPYSFRNSSLIPNNQLTKIENRFSNFYAFNRVSFNPFLNITILFNSAISELNVFHSILFFLKYNKSPL